MRTIGDEFNCQQEPKNDEDRYAVAVNGDTESGDVLGHLPREILCVSFFLEHDGSITGRVTDWRLLTSERWNEDSLRVDIQWEMETHPET